MPMFILGRKKQRLLLVPANSISASEIESTLQSPIATVKEARGGNMV